MASPSGANFLSRSTYRGPVMAFAVMHQGLSRSKHLAAFETAGLVSGRNEAAEWADSLGREIAVVPFQA
jgi:hypothetical protein